MKKYILFLVIDILLFQHTGFTQNNNLRYEILLNSEMLKDSVLSGPLVNCLEVSRQHFLTLSNGTQMYLLGWRGVTTLGKRSNQPIHGFAYTSEGLLLAVQSGNLCYINAEGNWEKLYRLPSAGMSITRGKEVMYLYDSEQKMGKYNVYALAREGRFKNLFVSPKPIKGICELGDSIFIAIENGIYTYSPQNNKLNLRLALDKEMVITSFTVDPVTEIFYFSTRTSIYAYRQNSLVMFTNEFPSATVKYFGNGLFIFNHLSKDILRIVNVESSIEFENPSAGAFSCR